MIARADSFSDSIIDRMPPHSADAKRALVASLALCDGDTLIYSEVGAMVTADDFFCEDNRELFKSLMAMHKAGNKIDGLTLCENLESRKILEDVGGKHYVGVVLNTVPSTAHYAAYAKIVQEKSRYRGMIEIGQRLLNAGYTATGNIAAADQISAEMKRLNEVVSRGSSTGARHIADIMADVHFQLENGGTPLIPTGFNGIDSIIGGIALGEMVIVAGRPSMGKSLFAKNVGELVAKSGVPVGIISLEEGDLKIGRNLLASASGIDNRRLRNGQIKPGEWNQISDGVAKVSQMPLYVDHRARRMSDIKSRVAGWVARDGVQLIIIDYIQRIRGVQGRTAYETTSQISLDVSDLAKEMNVALIAVAQLNRGVESRDDKRPTMADLRDSGQIEQDADGILLLHRPDYYGLATPGYLPTQTAEVIIAKWRDGTRGKIVNLHTNLPLQRFEDVPANVAHDPSEDL